MSAAVLNPPATVRFPGATAHLTSCPEPAPGMWLNEASRALAEAGASVADVVAFRRTALIEGTAALLAVILTWMLVD